jgi:uncharacterized protein involved in tolerance to divalent cations
VARKSQVDRIKGIIREEHICSVPEVVAIPVIGGNPDHLDWIGREVPEIGRV